MSDTYGLTSRKLLASYSPSESSWKTSEDISPLDSRNFSKTLPKLGMTQNEQLFELVMLEPHTKEPDSSLLPTPTVRHITNHDEPIDQFLNRQARSSTGQIGMSTGVALRIYNVPTPTASDATWEHKERNGIKGNHNLSLPNWAKMLPTPQARDFKGASTRGTYMPNVVISGIGKYRIHWQKIN